jgi:hypothetical protein
MRAYGESSGVGAPETRRAFFQCQFFKMPGLQARSEGIRIMNKQVIEYAGEPVGIAVPEDGKLRFIAVKFHVMDLDAQLFPTAAEVNAAIHRLVEHRPPQLHS